LVLHTAVGGGEPPVLASTARDGTRDPSPDCARACERELATRDRESGGRQETITGGAATPPASRARVGRGRAAQRDATRDAAVHAPACRPLRRRAMQDAMVHTGLHGQA